MLAEFELDGQKFTALNGGPFFKFTEAVSFIVSCETQDEVDRMWTKLSEGGETSQCGWLKDKFGLSWQIVPAARMELMSDPDPAKQDRVMAVLLTMTKRDIAALRRPTRADLPYHRVDRRTPPTSISQIPDYPLSNSTGARCRLSAAPPWC